jgi:hypothetical protein
VKNITTLEQYLEKSAGFAEMVANHPWKSMMGMGALGAGAGAAGTLAAQRYMNGTPSASDTPMGQGAGGGVFGSFIGGIGSSIGKELTSSAWKAGKRAINSGDPDAVFSSTIKQDDMLAGADKKMLSGAFETMRRFAPTLASDPNAVQAFLREAATTGSGVNYNTIKLLAEAERAVNTSAG